VVRALYIVGVALLAVACTTVVMLVFEMVSALAAGIDPLEPPKDVRLIPAWAVLLVLAGSVLGALLGGWIVGRLSPWKPVVLAAIVGGLFTLGQVANLQSTPHPTWFVVPGLLAFLPAYLWMARSAAAGRADRIPT
jgi:hypothetical protein